MKPCVFVTRKVTNMGVLLCVVSGLAVVGFGVARLKAWRGQKQTVQTLIDLVKCYPLLP